jgi:hypothetical protein
LIWFTLAKVAVTDKNNNDKNINLFFYCPTEDVLHCDQCVEPPVRALNTVEKRIMRMPARALEGFCTDCTAPAMVGLP